MFIKGTSIPIEIIEKIMESRMDIKYQTIEVLYDFKYVKILEYFFMRNNSE